MTAAQQELEQNTNQLEEEDPIEGGEVHSSQISYEEEKVDDSQADNNGMESVEDDEDLGSELSGISVEIPDEVEDITRSANYLTNYDRFYKSGVLFEKKREGRRGIDIAQIKGYLFRSNEENKEEVKERN